MIGSGIGSLAGGFISEGLGGSFEFGAAVGSLAGSFVGGKIYKAYDLRKVNTISKQGAVVIGENVTRIITEANRINAGTFQVSKFARIVNNVNKKLGSLLAYSENITWIKRVIRSGVDIVDIGIDINRVIRSRFYNMELNNILKYLLQM